MTTLPGSGMANNPNFRTPAPQWRAYVFVHSLLSPIQKGIQGAHALQALAVKYRAPKKGSEQIANDYWEWAKNHRTVIFCEGGFTNDLDDLFDVLFHKGVRYPRAYFHEDKATLGGLMTAMAIVLPDSIYQLASLVRKNSPDDQQYISAAMSTLFFYYQTLVERISTASLAR